MPGMARAIYLIIPVLFYCATPLVAGEIEGTVRAGIRGNPVEHATVQLLKQHFVIAERRTFSDGRFNFLNLAIGTYVVRVRADDFKQQDIDLLLFLSTSREVLEVNLLPRETPPIVLGGTVSVNALQAPNNARNEYEKGLEEHRRGKCEKAVPRFEKAIALFEQYGDAHNELGAGIYPSMNLSDLYASQKRYAEGLEILRKAIDQYPAEGDLYFGLAKVHFDQGQMREAVAEGLMAHGRTHRMADVHILLAKAYLNLGDRPAVTVQLRLYLEENPKGPLADQVRKNLATADAPPSRR
jgi:tetratricopeptide (TPR) repeat protein